MEKEVKAIIFDIGGVLVKCDWESLKKRIMKKYGFSILLYSDYPKKIQKRFKGLSTGKTSFRKVISYLSGLKNTQKLIKDYKKEYIECQKLNKNLLKLIKKLKRKYKLFYLTDTNDVHLEANREKLLKNFYHGYGSCEIGYKKINKKAFFPLFKSLSPKESVFIDDRKENIKTAKKLGIHAIQFKNNKQLVKDLIKLGVKI